MAAGALPLGGCANPEFLLASLDGDPARPAAGAGGPLFALAFGGTGAAGQPAATRIPYESPAIGDSTGGLAAIDDKIPVPGLDSSIWTDDFGDLFGGDDSPASGAPSIEDIDPGFQPCGQPCPSVGDLELTLPEFGDLTPVPVPAAVWLMGSALAGLGLIGVRRRRT